MSLINEALKKAQIMQARTPSSAPPPPAAPGAAPKLKTRAAQVVPPPVVAATTTTGHPTAAARRPSGNSKVVLAVGVSLFMVAMAVLAFALFVLLGRPSDEPTTAQAPTETPIDANAKPAATATDASDNPATDENGEPISAPPDTTATAPVEPTPVAETPPPPPPPPPKRINRPNARIQEFVNKITLSGIRTGERARVLMNDRVYSVGDVVNAELDLRVRSVSTHLVEFEDVEGNTYALHP